MTTAGLVILIIFIIIVIILAVLLISRIKIIPQSHFYNNRKTWKISQNNSKWTSLYLAIYWKNWFKR